MHSGQTGYQALEKVKIANSVSNIEDFAFYNATGLKHINIPKGVIKIGEQAFWKSGLESVVIPNNVQNIGTCAFWETNLKTIFILTKDASSIIIGDRAFSNIQSDSTIYILDGVEGLEEKLEGTYDSSKTTITKVSQAEMEQLIMSNNN